MSPESLLGTMTTAFMAGLLGSGHCFAMCGAIAAAPAVAGERKALETLVFNGARLVSYAVLGAVLAALAASAGDYARIASWGTVLRLLAAALIFAVGLQFLTGKALLRPLERMGAWVWTRVSPWASRTASLPPIAGRMALGLLWGLLPCGLVYTALLLALTSGSASGGALVMLAFGLGTAPALVGLGLASGGIASFMKDRFVRCFIGAGLLLLASWSAYHAIMGMSAATHVH